MKEKRIFEYFFFLEDIPMQMRAENYPFHKLRMIIIMYIHSIYKMFIEFRLAMVILCYLQILCKTKIKYGLS